MSEQSKQISKCLMDLRSEEIIAYFDKNKKEVRISTINGF